LIDFRLGESSPMVPMVPVPNGCSSGRAWSIGRMLLC
jgi:hypothetical protein